MSEDIFYSVVIPSYLEARNLEVLLPRILKILPGLGKPSEVIVLDANPILDNTPAVCKSYGIRHEVRLGGNAYGDAVRTGIATARGRVVVFMDADGSHNPEDILVMAKHIEKVDVVIASRYIDGGRTDNNLLLIILSQIVNHTFRIVLGLSCKDVSNSFKMYHIDNLRSLTLTSMNFDIIEEILYKTKRKNIDFQYIEIPASFRKRMFGESKRNLFLFALGYLYTLIKLRLSA